MDTRWLWHPDCRPETGAYAIPVILYRAKGEDSIYSPTIMKMEGRECAEDYYLMPVVQEHVASLEAVILDVSRAYRKILGDPTKSAARFDYWMQTKDSLFAPEPIEKRSAIAALNFPMWKAAGVNRPTRVRNLQALLGSPSAVNLGQLQQLERKLGLQ